MKTIVTIELTVLTYSVVLKILGHQANTFTTLCSQWSPTHIKVVVELQYDLDIYPQIGDDIKNSKTSKERAGWKNAQKLLRKGIRDNLELLDRYAEFHSFKFPERHRHLLTINPPPVEGGENWVVESRLRYLTRVRGSIPLPSTRLAPVVLRRRIRIVFDASTDRRS